MKIEQEVLALLERDVDVRKLVDRLFFTPDDLETAAMKQPKLFLEAGRFRAQASLRVATLKRRLGKIYGEASIKIRHKRTGVTETAIKNNLTTNKDVQEAQKKLDNAEVIEEFAKQLMEAYKERMMVLSVLARIKASEIGAELRKIESSQTVEAMRKKAKAARDKFTELEDHE